MQSNRYRQQTGSRAFLCGDIICLCPGSINKYLIILTFMFIFFSVQLEKELFYSFSGTQCLRLRLSHTDALFSSPQVILLTRRRRQRRRQESHRWMRLCQCTGGTVTRRCTQAATSTQVVASTCSSLTTPIHSGAPRVFTTESTTPDKPEHRHGGSQVVCVVMHICVRVCVRDR